MRGLIALGLLAYWFTSRTHHEGAAFESPPVPPVEPTKQDVSPPATSTSDLPEVQPGGKSPQTELPAKEAPAQLDTGKVNGKSATKKTGDVTTKPSIPPDTTTQSKGTR